jgi:hypothetical protein
MIERGREVGAVRMEGEDQPPDERFLDLRAHIDDAPDAGVAVWGGIGQAAAETIVGITNGGELATIEEHLAAGADG